MYNYNPTIINTLREQSVEKAKRLKEILGDSSDDQQQKKKNINLLIVTDYAGKDQFDDLFDVNKVWQIRQISSFANYETFVDICKNYNFKNICVVHHGNVYSEKENYPDDLKVIIGSTNFEQLRKSFEALPERDLMTLDDEYFENFRKETEKYALSGYKLIEVKAYVSLRLLFSKMLDNSTYISFACDEADDKDTMLELGKITDKKNIKIFANSNFSDIRTRAWEKDINGKKFYFGSALNKPATSIEEWKDANGWKYLDKSNDKIIATKKDLWIYSSSKTKVYELCDRLKAYDEKKDPLYKKLIYAQKYFSQKYRKMYLGKYGKAKFEYWKIETEKAYPELKN